MAHYIGIEGVREKLYQLLALELAAKDFVCQHSIGVPEFEKLITKEQYWSYSKSTVSNSTLEISVKIRSAMDLLESQGVAIDPKNCISVFPIRVPSDDQKLEKNLRYVCNKIIHANEFSIDAIGSTDLHEKLLWWSGMVTIAGKHQGSNGKEWCFFLYLSEWAKACLEFLSEHEIELAQIQINSFDLLSRRIS